MIRLVEDIIQLSSLDEAAVPLERETVDLYDLADACLANLQPVAAKQHVTLQLSGTHETVRGVWQILNEMVYNLCDNAIAYNRNGGHVKLTAERVGRGARVVVEDNGVGIARDQQERVFERFYRVESTRAAYAQGTGLGLPLVSSIVASVDGKIGLESDLGEGSTFTVVLPATNQKTEMAAAEKKER